MALALALLIVGIGFFHFAVVDFAERFPLELKSLKLALKWAPNHFI